MGEPSRRGRVAVVTGASKGGTGTAIAVRLAAEGAKVALVARDAEGLAAAAARIADLGGEALCLPCDLADPDGGRSEILNRVLDRFGRVDILVNNAAANGYRPFEEWTAKQLMIAQQVNVWAPWELMAHAAAFMKTTGSGWIVNITSFAAKFAPGPPFPSTKVALEGAGYGTTKAALNRLTVSVAAELFAHGISVNALAPQSAIATPQLQRLGSIDPRSFEPMETMAEAVLALSSTDKADLTGRVLRSLQLLVELDRPVRTLDATALLPGWQPQDLPEIIRTQELHLADRGWPNAFGIRT